MPISVGSVTAVECVRLRLAGFFSITVYSILRIPAFPARSVLMKNTDGLVKTGKLFARGLIHNNYLKSSSLKHVYILKYFLLSLARKRPYKTSSGSAFQREHRRE